MNVDTFVKWIVGGTIAALLAFILALLLVMIPGTMFGWVAQVPGHPNEYEVPTLPVTIVWAVLFFSFLWGIKEL